MPYMHAYMYIGIQLHTCIKVYECKSVHVYLQTYVRTTTKYVIEYIPVRLVTNSNIVIIILLTYIYIQ